MPTTLISNTAHYTHVLTHCKDVKHTLWIGTADIKDAYIEVGDEKMPFLKLLAQLIRKGVEVRLIHAKEPGPADCGHHSQSTLGALACQAYVHPSSCSSR